MVVEDVLEVAGNTVINCISSGNARGKRACKKVGGGAGALLVRVIMIRGGIDDILTA